MPDGPPTLRNNLEKAYKKAVEEGTNPFVDHIIVDVGSSPQFGVSMVGVCPTLTKSRAGSLGYWSSTKGGRLDTEEMS
eukprot:233381-Karenia_brevis.AAC.1